MTKILNSQDIIRLDVPIEQIFKSVEEALIAHSQNDVFLLPKVTLRPTDDTFYTAMPGGIKKWGIMGNKTIQRVSSPGNGPSVKGSMFLNDLHTGKLLAIMDATWLTSMRTGIIAALTAKYLAKKQVKKVGIMGLGNTGTAALLCLNYAMPDLNYVILNYKNHVSRIYRRFPNNNFTVVDTTEDLFVDTDIVITALTYASKPFVKPEWMTPGLLAIPIHMRGWQDCDPYFDKVFTDDHNHIKSWMPKVDGELGGVISGLNKGRTNDNEKIIAYNYGIAIDDIAIAKVIYETALEKNIGMDWNMEDFNNQYII